MWRSSSPTCTPPPLTGSLQRRRTRRPRSSPAPTTSRPSALPVFDRVAHLADTLLFLTPEEADLVRRRFRLSGPHHVVGLGAELDQPTAAAPDLGVGDDPYLLYVGRIDPSKGTSWLVESFVALKAARPSALRLVLLGEAVVDPGEHPDVVVVSDADDPTRNAAMRDAVALVHPSPYESFGMVVTEAWAAGHPGHRLRWERRAPRPRRAQRRRSAGARRSRARRRGRAAPWRPRPPRRSGAGGAPPRRSSATPGPS